LATKMQARALLNFKLALCFLFVQVTTAEDHDSVATTTSTVFNIEGKIVAPDGVSFGKNWQQETKILANYGEYIGFVSSDGSFVISNVPSGSYIIEVANKNFIFEPVRVDVNSKGKVRARKLQLLQPSAVTQLPYPLRFRPKEPARYFQVRESCRITDFLFSPMVLMMVVPLLCIMVLPKLVDTNDPEIQREMQNSLQLPKYEMPELSDIMTNLFGGGKAKPSTKTKAIKKKPA